MKSSVASMLTAMAVVGYASAQVTANPNDTFTCAKPSVNYCAGDSLTTNLIVFCNSESVGAPGNCNDELSGIAHEDDVARCYESSATAGDAACEFNGTVYPANGTPFPVPSATATPVANFANWMEKRDTTEECTTTSGAAALVTVTAVASYTDGYDSILTAATGSVPSSIVVESAPYPVVSTGSGTNMTAAATGTGVMSGSAAALTSLLTATGTPTIPASGAVASSSSGIATGAGSKSVNVNMFSGLMIGTVGAVAALLI